MENLDIVILTSIVATLFIVFFIAIYREFSSMAKTPYKYEKESGPRADMVNFLGNLFDDSSTTKKEKKMIYKAMNRTIADMESDGIYFSEDVKDELKRQRDELNCEYSGLPSVKAYDINNIIK